MREEVFTVELYKLLTKEESRNFEDAWRNSCYMGDTYEECDEWIDKHPVDEPYYYSIWCHEYENDKKVKEYPVI